MRTTLISLVAALSLLAAGCGGDDGPSGSATERLEAAFENQVTSADISLGFEASLEGVEDLDGPITFSLEGPYGQEDPEQFPIFDWDVAFEGAGQSFEAQITATEDNAYVEYEDEAYEVGEEAFTQLTAQQEDQGTPFTPQALRELGVDPTTWLTDPSIEEGDEIGGDSTDVISGDVDLRKVVEDIVKLSQSPLLQQQAPDIEPPTDEELQQLEDAVEELTVEFNVDDDDVLRRTHVEGSFTVPEGADADGLTGGSVTLDFALEDVGGEPEIEAPSDPRPITELGEALQGLGGDLP